MQTGQVTSEFDHDDSGPIKTVVGLAGAVGLTGPARHGHLASGAIDRNGRPTVPVLVREVDQQGRLVVLYAQAMAGVRLLMQSSRDLARD